MSTTSNLPTSNTPLFGRKYELIVTTPDGTVYTISSSAWEPEALKFTAEIELKLAAFWQALITVYNADLLPQFPIGSEITLSAGYQTGSRYGVVFNGQIIRTMIDRPNGTDWVTTYQCIVGYDLLVNNFVNYAYGPGQTQEQIIQQMAANARNNFTIQGTELLKTIQLPRAGVVWGAPREFLAKVARDNNLFFTMTSTANVVSFVQLKQTSAAPFRTYSVPIPQGSSIQAQAGVDYSIIGTPQQNPNGVGLKVLCDSGLTILAPNAQTIKIDNTVIRQTLAAFGGTGAIGYPLLTTDGVYAVAGVRHILDSRGNDWYTEIFAVITASQQMQLMGVNTGGQDPNDADINSKLAGKGN